MLNAGRVHGDLLDALHEPLRPVGGGGIGQLNVEEQVALVLLRHEAGGRADKLEIGQHQQAGIDEQGDQAGAEQAGYHANIQGRADAEEPVEQPEEPTEQRIQQPGQSRRAGTSGAVRLEQNSRQGGTER